MDNMADPLIGAISLIVALVNIVVCEDVTVVTTLGNITGETEEVTFDGSTFDVTKFLGLPYAEPPIGSLRFNKPIEKGPFTTTFIAKTMSVECVQNLELLRIMGEDPLTKHMAEDCLYLNIFVPGGGAINKSQKQAVMIWIYGGGFSTGSQNSYDAKAFVGLNDVILVTFNYRLSLLGFLSTAEDNWSGNYGLWDQHMAIKWVNKHIGSFGGDSQRVTLFGESAGSSSVIYQAMYEGNSGLFQRIIAQSGSANSPWAYHRNPTERYHNFANKSGCLNETTNTRKVIECLRDLSVNNITELIGISDDYFPIKDGKFVTMRPTDVFRNDTIVAGDILKRLGKLDMIIGVNSAEGGELIAYVDALVGNNQLTNSYSKDAFASIIVPFGFERAKLKESTTLLKAFQHQYFDWTDPENTDKIFHNTVNLISDIEYNDPVTKTALAHSDTGEAGKLFFYVFDYNGLISDDRLNGASHAEEIAFVLGFPTSFAFLYTIFGLTIPQNEIDLSRKMMKYWTNFAKSR